MNIKWSLIEIGCVRQGWPTPYGFERRVKKKKKKLIYLFYYGYICKIWDHLQ